MAKLLSETEQSGLIIIPEDKWGLFSAIHNYPICIARGHDWMHFFVSLANGGADVFWFCRRCGLERNRTGKWDAAHRDSDALSDEIVRGE